MAVFDELRASILGGNPESAGELTRKAVRDGHRAEEILRDVLIPGIQEVGEKFGRDELYLPELLVAGLAMKEAVGVLRPLLAQSGVKTAGKVLIATVRGDLHDIGKNLVGMMLEGAGFEVIDLGVDIPSEGIVKAARENQAQLVCLSSLLTTTMPGMRETVKEIKKAGLAQTVKVMVGGAPVTQGFADDIGADGYAPDAPSAARKAKEILES
jgi:5-methyltetrahydrofolate--homocysteine methyltransferase